MYKVFSYELNKMKHLYLMGLFIWRYLKQKLKSPKYEIVKYSFEFSHWYRIAKTQLLNFRVCLNIEGTSS